jgi:hypothetical protein
MKINHLNFEVKWVPGKRIEEADALSQAPIHQATEEDEIDKIEKLFHHPNSTFGL